MKRAGLAIWMVTLSIILPSGVMAEFNLIPSLAVREEYNDNIFFSYSDTIDDFITTVSAGLELTERTEQLDLKPCRNRFSVFLRRQQCRGRRGSKLCWED